MLRSIFVQHSQKQRHFILDRSKPFSKTLTICNGSKQTNFDTVNFLLDMCEKDFFYPDAFNKINEQF